MSNDPVISEQHDREYATNMLNEFDEYVTAMCAACSKLAQARDATLAKRAVIEAQRSYRDEDGILNPPPIAEIIERSFVLRFDQTLRELCEYEQWVGRDLIARTMSAAVS